MCKGEDVGEVVQALKDCMQTQEIFMHDLIRSDEHDS